MSKLSMGSSTGVKLHTFARSTCWDYNQQIQIQTHDPPSLSLGCKRFRPLAPKLTNNNNNNPNTNTNVNVNVNVNTIDLKSFIKPESGPRKFVSSYDEKKDLTSHQVETHPGGTRWNPTQEQIGILEMLYKEGMRTPNAQQIEQITEQLAKYGKIEGKNVFYWFQNHKARERQKKKRGLLQTPCLNSLHASSIFLSLDTRVEIDQQGEISPCKRKIRDWTFEFHQDNNNIKKNTMVECHQTLELFPLHPETR